VLLTALNCLQGARYIELTEGREADEAYLFGWAANRVSAHRVSLLAIVAVAAAIGAATACATLVLLIALLVRSAPAVIAALGRLLGSWVSQAL
jgi:hypothetical protein